MKSYKEQFFLQGRSLCRFAAIAIFIAMITLLPIHGQDDKKKAEELRKQQEKIAKAEAEAAKKQAKREKRYAKVRDFAKGEYNTDPDFKDSIDDRYRQVREEQTRYAYLVNTTASNMKLINREGEKIRFNQALYDNPLAQDYVNRVGQSLVPPTSKKLYAFKILQNPVPESKSLSTGSVYITTGLLSIIDNEAQLAYILGHEIAHIERDHWFEDILVDLGNEPYSEKNEKTKRFFGFLGKAALGAAVGSVAAASILKNYNLDGAFQWESVQEDEADVDSMKYMFQRNYDVREIPKFYARMEELTKDPRSQTGFIADPTRIGERMDEFRKSATAYTKTTGALVGAVDLAADRAKNLKVTGRRSPISEMLNKTMAPDIQAKLEKEELIASSEEFQSVMALAKRDNGIRAWQFDMFSLARNNLEDSIAIRSNDPYAYYYYGKVVKQTARNAAEISTALSNLNQAINADKRQTIAEPYLFRALLLLAGRNPNEGNRIANDLRKYVEIYQRENKGDLPPNMEFVYDFMQDLEVLEYRASPAANTAEAPKMVMGSQPMGAAQPPVQPTTASIPAVVGPPPTAAAKPTPTPAPKKKP